MQHLSIEIVFVAQIVRDLRATKKAPQEKEFRRVAATGMELRSWGNLLDPEF